MGWWKRWRSRRACKHHNPATGRTWIKQEIIDGGRGKRFWCAGDSNIGAKGCGKVWLT
jgi:hypothetical protein